MKKRKKKVLRMEQSQYIVPNDNDTKKRKQIILKTKKILPKIFKCEHCQFNRTFEPFFSKGKPYCSQCFATISKAQHNGHVELEHKNKLKQIIYNIKIMVLILVIIFTLLLLYSIT